MDLIRFEIPLLNTVTLLRTGFLSAAATILFIYFIPTFRTRFITYGSRASTASNKPEELSANAQTDGSRSPLTRLLDHFSSYTVPHAWFKHFYILSVASSLFWTCQYLTDSRLTTALASLNRNSASSSTPRSITVYALLLLLTQGLRRLTEEHHKPPSASRMWLGHYLLGLLFYIFIGIAIWVEGTRDSPTTRSYHKPEAYSKFVVGTELFLFGTAVQHRAHCILARLEKYTLPTEGPFKWLLCPHYTGECLIYLGLAVVTAPPSSVVNKTVFAGSVFVAANLAVTANETREWYARKFGQEGVRGRWRMVPYVY